MKKQLALLVLTLCLLSPAPGQGAAAAPRPAKSGPGSALPRLEGVWRAEGTDEYQVMHIEIDAAARTATFSEGPKSRSCIFAVEKEQADSITLFLKEPKTTVTFELMDRDNIRIREGEHARILTRVRSRAAPGQPGPGAPALAAPGPALPASAGKIHTPLNRPRYLPGSPDTGGR